MVSLPSSILSRICRRAASSLCERSLPCPPVVRQQRTRIPTMVLKPFRMGSEVEYSMSSRQPNARLLREQYHEWLLNAIRGEHRWLPDISTPSGIYIDNGARYYLDCGCHNEFSSPELSTPREIAVYD